MLSDGHVIYWWVEILAIIAFYVVYSAIRNIHGGNLHAAAARVRPRAPDHVARASSRDLPRADVPALGAALPPADPLLELLLRLVPLHRHLFAGVLLYRSFSDDYPRFRNTIAIATLLALIGFTFYPLAPPRMFPGFVDTLLKDPAFWSFNSGGAEKVSNQYAAMPSVHIAWSTWCALALGPRLKHKTHARAGVALPVHHLRRHRDHREPLHPRRGRRPRSCSASRGSSRTRSRVPAWSTFAALARCLLSRRLRTITAPEHPGSLRRS